MSIHKAHTAHNLFRDDTSTPFQTTVVLMVNWNDHPDYDGVGAALEAMDAEPLVRGKILSIVRKTDGLHVTLDTETLNWVKAGQFEEAVTVAFWEIQVTVAKTVPWQADDC